MAEYVPDIGGPGSVGLDIPNVIIFARADVGTGGLNVALAVGDVLMLDFDGTTSLKWDKLLVPTSAAIGAVGTLVFKPLVVVQKAVAIGTASSVIVTIPVMLRGRTLAASTGSPGAGVACIANTSKQLATAVGAAACTRVVALTMAAAAGGMNDVLFDGLGQVGLNTAAS